jgi:hypothetical protein
MKLSALILAPLSRSAYNSIAFSSTPGGKRMFGLQWRAVASMAAQDAARAPMQCNHGCQSHLHSSSTTTLCSALRPAALHTAGGVGIKNSSEYKISRRQLAQQLHYGGTHRHRTVVPLAASRPVSTLGLQPSPSSNASSGAGSAQEVQSEGVSLQGLQIPKHVAVSARMPCMQGLELLQNSPFSV